MGDVEVPPGVFPIFLTNTTQQMFHVVSGTDVTEQAPYKRVSVAEILKDIQFRGVISDWQPAKAQIEKFKNGDVPAEELEVLVVLDEDNVYGQNYYLCYTEEAAQSVIEKFSSQKEETAQEAVEEAAEEEEPPPKEIVDPDLVNRPWIEWVPPEGDTSKAVKTSEELDALVVRDSQGPRLKFSMSKKRKLFGVGGKLNDVDHIEVEDFKPYRDPQYKENQEMGPGVYGTRCLLRDSGNQCVSRTVEMSTQTPRYRLVNSMVQYAPIMQEHTEEEKALLCSNINEMLERSVPLIMEAIQTNETIQVFQDDLANLGDEETLGNTSDNAIKEYSSPFTDINYSKNKIISAIDWMPDAKGVVAVACTDRSSLDEQVEYDGKVQVSHILIWNFKDPIHPQFVLEAPSDVHSFRFNPKNSDIIAAGLASGQVLQYNIGPAKEQAAKKEKGGAAANGSEEGAGSKDEVNLIKHELSSTIEGSHRRAISDLIWLPANKEVYPRTGHLIQSTITDGIPQQFLTVSSDGMLLFWDLRAKKEDKSGSLVWTPIYRILMNSLESAGDLSGNRLSLRSALEGEDATKFNIGTEDGEVVEGSWILPEEEGATYLKSSYTGHYGPVVSLQRSPFFDDTLLTVGDWTFCIFKSGAKEPVVRSSFAPTFLTRGRFSPTRPGVIVTSRADGCVDVWDLTDRSHEASLQHNVGPLLAVGDAQGTLHILEIPRNLRRPLPNEQTLIDSLLQRELARVRYMHTRMAFREKELAVKEAEDEEKRRIEEEAAAKAAAEEAAAREAAEAEAQALAAGDEQAAEEKPADVPCLLGLARRDKPQEGDEASVQKLSKEDEDAEARYRAIEAQFREKLDLNKT
ncbi:hypothetical protein GUITHDRAFT_161883 [Guillardia theta CCMP2712]|uniref:Uncharacterized protein n=1 Tax=Guillardia theta (strain CCMP2712) TaxID=905079 RepID=L1JQ11_GUITC|nr:hypothetical protein GUITHDRAFT_161883 [Guillardia theta CCMP2712]EKX50168.1 hypothetical protein GUITHDRAFT_161883 [Guillardia theta CCMP2712]|eukprot:XP_005837148.1 hypothetical protein GUITHDRAFT_161883 [Guillardia theta CCMP2712]